MKIRLLASSLVFVLICGAPLARAQDAQPAPGAPANTGVKKPKTALEKDMDQINHAVRTLKKQIDDATQNDDSLALVAKIHDAAEAALNETPAKAHDLPAADQAKFVADYQAAMKDFIGDVDKLGAALKAGDNDGAAKLLGRLGMDERTDHKQFRKPMSHSQHPPTPQS